MLACRLNVELILSKHITIVSEGDEIVSGNVQARSYRSVRRIFDEGISVRRRRGRPCLDWKDQIVDKMKSFSVFNQRRLARSRGA